MSGAFGHCGRVSAKLAQRLGPDRTAKGLHPVELRLDERAAAIIPASRRPAGLDTEFLDYILPSRSWTAWTRPLPTSLLTPPATAKHPDPDTGPRRPVHGSCGQCRRVCELFHPLYRWRRVRAGLRDGHLHPEAARPRPDGAGRALQLQVHHPRRWADPLSFPPPQCENNFLVQADVRRPGLHFCFIGMERFFFSNNF